jgi:hypothetical protein
VKSAELERLKFEVSILKNKKREDTYQYILEQHLKGTHKKLPSGISDITTDSFHAEIKNWQCWKAAHGQLLIYNTDDPKDELKVYFFGKTPGKKLVDIILKHFHKYNIQPFEIKLVENIVTITDLTEGSVEKFSFDL